MPLEQYDKMKTTRRTDTDAESHQRQRRAPCQPGSQRALRAKAQEHRPQKFLRANGPAHHAPKPFASDHPPYGLPPRLRVSEVCCVSAFPLSRFPLFQILYFSLSPHPPSPRGTTDHSPAIHRGVGDPKPLQAPQGWPSPAFFAFHNSYFALTSAQSPEP